jgi:hypothetical protein
MKCKAKTAKGTPCSNNSKFGDYCACHAPKIDPRNTRAPNYIILSDIFKANLLYILDTENDILKAFDAMDKFRMYFDATNDTYNFYVTRDVTLKFEAEIKKFMFNPKRIRMLIDYIFIYDERDITISFSEYDFDEVGTYKDNFDLYVAVYNYIFRGYEKKPHPIRSVVRPEEKLNSIIPNADFSKLDSEIFVTMNESVNFAELLKNVVLIREYIDKSNPKYDFNVQLDVIDFISDQLKIYIDNKRRIRLIIDYIFVYKNRDLTHPIKYYCCNINYTKSDTKYIESIHPRGFSQAPVRKSSESKPEPKHTASAGTTGAKPESKPETKPESKPEPKHTASAGTTGAKPETKQETKKQVSQSSKDKYIQGINELKKYMEIEDAKIYFKIICLSTLDLTYLTRDDIMKFYKKFHPDKSKGCETEKSLFTLISSKLSVLKEQIDSKDAKIKPVGSLYKDLCLILKI